MALPDQNNQKKETDSDRFQVRAPPVALPKGGGAIRGMGEKFAANPVTGTGSLSVPIPTSPGRSGFGPQLSLAYDSGAGNGTFGLGWSLSLPSITRKIDKGLPKYQDADESDVFILSGAEDLVPVGDATNDLSNTFSVRRYRPRIEGLFARIERWTELASRTIHWRSISKDNITTLYGRTAESRIADPADPTRIFSWLICESYDDKGNAIRYEYKAENADDVDLSAANERNRSRSAQRYLKRIKYGNKTPRQPNEDLALRTDWMFEVVFDYGEHYTESVQGQPTSVFVEDKQRQWTVRQDPFSSYRSGFEVRTYRLCQRVLMFHHFDELGTKDYLVRATHFAISQDPAASFVTAVTQSGYVRQENGGTYLKKSLPPVEFEYSKANIDETVREVDEDSLENIPYGLDGSRYQWVDLDGEGLSGILTEQGGAWFYKRNLGAVPISEPNEAPRYAARFAPVERLPTMPSPAYLSSGQQLLDLAGDGQLDVVEFDGPVPGFFERTPDEGWETFTSFASLPNVAWKDPNLRFVDLTGDGHADILITEDEVLTWYPSLAEEGFGPAEKIRQALEDETGPRLVFSGGTQSVYLSDLSGDGLTDLVRIRNGDVCYWPNLGYGRFGAKVTMDNAPWFDAPDQFDQKRIRLADISGSGTIDILYLSRDGVHLYFNRSGNSWSHARRLTNFPRVDNLSSVMAADLLGNGTACLVWSSPLPGDARRPMRYIDLMGGQKPHLLVKTMNNLGAETKVDYAPSTKFYLADKFAGRQWITKLPFPVHCVEKVTVIDKWRNTRFASTYSYHHGYFDGIEREFRGFGRVEQVDVESFGEFSAGNVASPYITNDHTLYQPAVKTITWFHTGVAFDRHRILTQFEAEYFPNSLAALPGYSALLAGFNEKPLPEPDLESQDLSADEWREALRACKGMTLRQEIYELDVDQLEAGKQIPVRLFSTATHNCHIRRLQPKGRNQHAVFLVTESEALSYHYELDLRSVTFPVDPGTIEPLKPDPRVAHTLNLSFDEYGNIQQSIAVGYKRARPFADSDLTEHLGLIHAVQGELHLAYTETHYTGDVIEPVAGTAIIQHYRLRVPWEVQTYELTGISPAQGRYFDLSELRGYHLSDILPDQGSTSVDKREYHEPVHSRAEKRKVEHVVTLFFGDDLTTALGHGQLHRLGLTYETYKLALTKPLLQAVFGNKFDSDTENAINTATVSGYWKGTDLLGNAGADQWWMRSGRAGFATDAAGHFYLPEEYTDPFGNKTKLRYDGNYDLFIESSTDALENRTGIYVDPDPNIGTRFDYRVLAPAEIEDINGNRTEAWFDVLGMVVAIAVKGKVNTAGVTEADNLDGYTVGLANPTGNDLAAIFAAATPDGSTARRLLGNATMRHLYHFGEAVDTNGNITWGNRPAGASAIVREQHAASLAIGDPPSPLQIAFECSDGMGTVLMKRSQAEPETTGSNLRWIVSGKTVLNNKGKPVKQYEPYFSSKASCCAEGDEHEEVGVTPLMYYDAAGRLVRTEMPDGTFSRVEFSPWHVKSFDANDTINESNNAWYAKHTEVGASDEDKRAAKQSLAHQDTPALTILDSLGREVIAIAHNRAEDANGSRVIDGKNYRDERYLTFTKLDAEGKPLWIRDARGNLVMQYITPGKPTRTAAEPDQQNIEAMPTGSVPCYDIAGNLLFQHSMDAGDRWMLMDAAGKPMFAWGFNDRNLDNGTTIAERRLFHTRYDALHRPVEQWLKINTNQPALIEAFEYIDTDSFKSAAGVVNQVALAAAQRHNLIGQATHHYDPSGLATVERVDFKGAVEEITRTLVDDVEAPIVDWNLADRGTLLEQETFIQITEHDALGRMIRHYNWHRDIAGQPGHSSRVAVYVPEYNQRGVLESETLHVRAAKQPGADGRASFDPHADTNKNVQAIKRITWNAKGQKLSLELGNGTVTRYTYDPDTFRLVRLYTRRDTRFTEDCGGEPPPPRTSAPDTNAPPRSCGVQNLHYTYDPVGNVTHTQDDAQQTIWFANQQVEPSNDYTYDALYRLIEATGRENSAAVGTPPHSEGPWSPGSAPSPDATRNYMQRYRYDSVGNVITMQHIAANFPGQPDGSWTREYAYAFDDPAQPASNRLWQTWQGGDRTQAVTYRHDPHGSMLNLANTAPGQDIRWDWRDMIRALDLQGGGDVFYTYGSDKQRTRKRIKRNGGGSEDRIYLGAYELYRRYQPNDPTPVEEIESLHLFEGEQRVLLVDDVLVAASQPGPNGLNVKQQTLFRYQYGNHLGSVGVELDETAKVISYEEFHPYGTSAYRLMNSAVEAPAKRYRYTGMERDEESGLNYHGARNYLPWMGRWAAADPLGIGDGINDYQFVRANPIRLQDGDGTQSKPDVFHSLPPALQAKILRGEINDRLSDTLRTAQLAEFTNVAPTREKTWEDRLLDITTLGGWSIGWTAAGNYDAVSSSPELSDLNPVVKGTMAFGMTAGDVTGTRDIVEGLREQDTLNTRSFSPEESFQKTVGGSVTLGTNLLLAAARPKKGPSGANAPVKPLPAREVPPAWTDFLPEAKARVEATKAAYGNVEAFASTTKKGSGPSPFKFENPKPGEPWLPPPPGTRNYPNKWGQGQSGRPSTETLRREYQQRTGQPVPADPNTGRPQQMSHEPPRWAGGPEHQVVPRPAAEHRNIDRLYRAIYRFWQGKDPASKP